MRALPQVKGKRGDGMYPRHLTTPAWFAERLRRCLRGSGINTRMSSVVHCIPSYQHIVHHVLCTRLRYPLVNEQTPESVVQGLDRSTPPHPSRCERWRAFDLPETRRLGWPGRAWMLPLHAAAGWRQRERIDEGFVQQRAQCSGAAFWTDGGDRDSGMSSVLGSSQADWCFRLGWAGQGWALMGMSGHTKCQVFHRVS